MNPIPKEQLEHYRVILDFESKHPAENPVGITRVTLDDDSRIEIQDSDGDVIAIVERRLNVPGGDWETHVWYTKTPLVNKGERENYLENYRSIIKRSKKALAVGEIR